MKRFEQWQDMVARLYPVSVNESTDNNKKSLSRTVTFQVTDKCNLACFVAGTKILMSDFSYKNIEDIKIGDTVMAFNEFTKKGKQLKLIPTKVTHTFVRHDFVRKITSADNEEIICTDEHPFLDGRRNWIRAEKINTSQKLTKFLGVNTANTMEVYDENCFKREDVKSVEILNSYKTVYNLETESHTYIANNFAVHNCNYCYQINKAERVLKFEYAKKLIDMLLEGDEKLGGYVDIKTSPGIILEFIGGEPFLQVELIEKICDYFVDKAIEMCHPWATMFCISICSNGVLYFDPKVQHFLNKYKDKLSFSVTIDGNKELHDSCRVFPDGSPSYDLAVAAANDWMSRGYYMGSKITIAPGNLKYLCDAVFHMVELGYEEINANCVYEKGWTIEHAQEFYKQLKTLADYWIDNDLVETHYLSLFVDTFFHPKKRG